MRHGMVGPRHAEAHRVRRLVGQQRTDLRVARVAPVRGAAEVPIGVARREQLVHRLSVVAVRAARRRAESHTEPREVAQDRPFRARNRAAAIGIINAHHERRIAASQLALPREEVVEQRRPRAAGVQRAGGRRREAEPYRFARRREGAAHLFFRAVPLESCVAAAGQPCTGCGDGGTQLLKVAVAIARGTNCVVNCCERYFF